MMYNKDSFIKAVKTAVAEVKPVYVLAENDFAWGEYIAVDDPDMDTRIAINATSFEHGVVQFEDENGLCVGFFGFQMKNGCIKILGCSDELIDAFKSIGIDCGKLYDDVSYENCVAGENQFCVYAYGKTDVYDEKERDRVTKMFLEYGMATEGSESEGYFSIASQLKLRNQYCMKP